ncbi:CoA transferase [Mycolicibacterium anyangense]|uniref:CoA transferase n=1 Tax=Mycolicibacterium anyangense TaxID=1431246 RepID=A0A6N4W7T1_9MYCO|nr:CoA transferase [Mycolicibacterium anyangense]BBZ78040.1 CoA transferase [Mycolicibacterium anyangense]
MSGPLQGIRVLDMSIMLTGPYAAALLADQGADVIKVERPDIGDLARWIGARVGGMTSLFLVCNRGKRSVAVDAHHHEGAAIIREVAASADVVIQNFRPGVMDKLNLGYDAIRAINPDVVCASLSGFGPVGPYRERGALDPIIQAYTGFATNQSDGPGAPPAFLHQATVDKVTALFACQAITAALFARDRGAGGQHLTLSMVDAGASFLWADAAGNEMLLDSDGSFPSTITAGFDPMCFADGWGAVAVVNDEQFVNLCRSLGVDGYDDPRLATTAARVANMGLLNDIMDLCHAAAANITMAEANDRFSAARLPFAMVTPPAALHEDPHAKAMGLFEEYHHPVAGRVRMPRHPTQFGSTPATLTRDAPTLGQHTEEVLNELGLADNLDALRRDTVIH